MFRVASPTEIAGQYDGGTDVSETILQVGLLQETQGSGAFIERLQGVDEYVYFGKCLPDEVKEASDITYVHAANAIAAFEASQWRADQSPDQYLQGSEDALNASQLRGSVFMVRRSVRIAIPANC